MRQYTPHAQVEDYGENIGDAEQFGEDEFRDDDFGEEPVKKSWETEVTKWAAIAAIATFMFGVLDRFAPPKKKGRS